MKDSTKETIVFGAVIMFFTAIYGLLIGLISYYNFVSATVSIRIGIAVFTATTILLFLLIFLISLQETDTHERLKMGL